MNKKRGSKETLEFCKHGLYRRPKSIDKLDGRRREVRAWKVFLGGVSEDLGELSFGQRSLCECAFWKAYALSEFMRTLMLSGREKAVMAIMGERNSRQFIAMSNSYRLDLIQIYGGDLRRAEKKVQTLESYLKSLPAKTEPGDGEPND
jgi:hypothetical protein